MALVGPTGVGKTAVSIELAQRMNAEIVSCDSMQVYKRLPMLTQAPTAEQRMRVPHHVIECVEPTAHFSAGAYRHMALPIINDILQRGKRVLIVGGTGLYLKALVEGLCDAPAVDGAIRQQLWTECRAQGSLALHNRLQAVDAVAASRIHPHDARRIIRAMEIFVATGTPLSRFWQQGKTEPLEEPVRLIGITRDREELYERIHERLLQMIYEDGVVNEVRRVLAEPLSSTARHVHGLPDLERYLSGAVSLKDTIAIWQQRVRQYAKRQLTWFRHTPGLEWMSIPAQEPPAQSAERLLAPLRANGRTDTLMPRAP